MVAFMIPEGDASELVIDHPNALRADDLHITLAFLGYADGIDEQSLRQAVADFANSAPPDTDSLSGLIIFPHQHGTDSIFSLI